MPEGSQNGQVRSRQVRAHHTRVVPIEDIRAKDGNLSIPLYVVVETTTAKEDAAEYRANELPAALSTWLESSAAVRQSLKTLLSE